MGVNDCCRRYPHKYEYETLFAGAVCFHVLPMCLGMGRNNGFFYRAHHDEIQAVGINDRLILHTGMIYHLETICYSVVLMPL